MRIKELKNLLYHCGCVFNCFGFVCVFFFPPRINLYLFKIKQWHVCPCIQAGSKCYPLTLDPTYTCTCTHSHTDAGMCHHSRMLPFVVPREGSIDQSGISLIRPSLSGMDWSVGEGITGNGTSAWDHQNDREHNGTRHPNLLHSGGFWRGLAAAGEGTFACR